MTNREFVEKFLIQMEARGWAYDTLFDGEEYETIYYLPLKDVMHEIFGLDEVSVTFRNYAGEKAIAFFVLSNEGEEVLADYTNIDEVEKTLRGMGIDVDPVF